MALEVVEQEPEAGAAAAGSGSGGADGIGEAEGDEYGKFGGVSLEDRMGGGWTDDEEGGEMSAAEAAQPRESQSIVPAVQQLEPESEPVLESDVAATMEPEAGYDYGEFGGVSMEDRMGSGWTNDEEAEPAAVGQHAEGQEEGEEEMTTQYDYGEFGGMPLEDAMGGGWSDDEDEESDDEEAGEAEETQHGTLLAHVPCAC